MAAISFITDFGLHEWYVGVMKGVIHNIDPSATTIEITHDIKNHSIVQAAFVLAWSYSFFAPESIHVVVVDPGVGGTRDPILLESQGHYFIGPDNGVFSLVDHTFSNCYVLDKKGYWLEHVSDTFHGRDIFSPVAAHLARGTPCNQLGSKRSGKITTIDIPKMTKEVDGTIVAQVLHVDRFGNCLVNVPSDILPRVSQIQSAIVTLPGQEITCVLAKTYEQASTGQPVIIIGSSGFLELSINKDHFATRYKLTEGVILRLRFVSK